MRRPPPPGRARTPPRDAKDIKCANCNLPGHTAAACTKPKVPMEQRKCRVCNKTGHLARNCPENKASKAAVVDTVGNEARADQRQVRCLCVTDEEGYSAVQRRRPKPIGTLISELPVRRRGTNQDERRRNRWSAFADVPREAEQEASANTRAEEDSPPRTALSLGSESLGSKRVRFQETRVTEES